MPTVFVTGGTGYVGRHVLSAMRARGWMVDCLVRSPASAEAARALGARPVPGDLRDHAAVAAGARVCDGAVHLAALAGPGRPEGDSPEADTADEAGVAALLEGLAGSAKPLVVASSLAVYGQVRSTGDTALLDEADEPLPPGFIAARLRRETLVRGAHGIRGIALRPALMHGGRGGLWSQIRVRSVRAGAGLHIGRGDNAMATLHVDDFAQLVMAAFERAPAGAAYAALDGWVEPRVAAGAIASGLGANGTRCWPLHDALAQLGTAVVVASMDQHVRAHRATRELGWAPRGAGLLETLARPETAA